MWLLKTGDPLIEVTTSAGLTVLSKRAVKPKTTNQVTRIKFK